MKKRQEEGTPAIFNLFTERESCGKDQSHQLTTNFRSTQRILDLVSYVRNYHETLQRPKLQSAHKEYGEYPVLLQVHSETHSTQLNTSNESGLATLLTHAALDQIQQLPETKRGSIVLIVAREHLRLPVERYLKKQGQDFRVMNSNSYYQLRHIDRVLVYLRLIVDNTKNEDVAFWLSSSLVPYFYEHQVKMLRELAQQPRHTLFEMLEDTQALTKIQAKPEQRAVLETHLSVLARFHQASKVSQVIDAVRSIKDGPIAVLDEDEQKKEDVEKVLEYFQHFTVAKAVAEIQQHISFLKDSQKHTGLTVTNIDNAKSEEFDTVFLLGADLLKNTNNSHVSSSDKRRMYVSLSRARQHLFLVVHEGIQGNELLASIPKQLYEERVWSPSKLLQV